MENKRPSIFTIYVIIGVVILVAIIIFFAINHSKVSDNSRSLSMEKINSIAGEENIELDEEGNKTNASSEVLSKKEVDGFVFDSFNIVTNSGISTMTFEIYNPNDQDEELGEYEIQVLDSNGNMIGRITDNGGIIEGLSRKEVSVQLKGDIANLTDLHIRKIVYENM